MKNVAFLFLLSALSSLSVSADFVNPEDIEKSKSATYALTLSTDPTKALDSAHAILSVESFDPKQPWNPTNVGPDNGRRWKFEDDPTKQSHSNELRYLMRSVGGGGKGGYLDYTVKWSMGTKLKLRTDKSFRPRNFILAPENGGLKIGFLLSRENVWVNAEGKPDQNPDNAAIWMITKTTEKDHWE